MDDEGGLSETDAEQEELEQSSDSLVDILTGREILNPSEKEHALQRMIQALGAEYHFPLESMQRDVNIPIQTADGKRRKRIADLVIYAPGQPHTLDHACRRGGNHSRRCQRLVRPCWLCLACSSSLKVALMCHPP